jgi:hypothetical protein
MGILVANGNSSATASLTPLAFTRLLSIAKGYEFYRFTRVSVRIPPITRFETSIPQTSTANLYAFGYLPEQPSGSSTSLTPASVAALQASFTGSTTIANSTLNTLWVSGETAERVLRVPKAVLLSNPLQRYRVATISEDPATVQGTFCLSLGDTAGSNTVIMYATLDYTVEFSGASDEPNEMPSSAAIIVAAAKSEQQDWSEVPDTPEKDVVMGDQAAPRRLSGAIPAPQKSALLVPSALAGAPRR